MPSDDRFLALDRANAVLLVIDVQEKLAAAMPPEQRAAMEKNIEVLIRSAVRLGLPVVATEQYPKGLGPTVARLRALLPEEPLQKMEFSCGNSKVAARKIIGAGRKQEIAPPCGFEKGSLMRAQMKRTFEFGRLARPLGSKKEKSRIGGDDCSLLRAQEIAGILRRKD